MSQKIERFEKRIKTIGENLAEVKKELDPEKLKKEKNKISESISLIKEEIQEDLEELKKDIDKNADDIKKLEELSKKVDSFSVELDSLKEEVSKNKESDEEDEEDEEGNASLFSRIIYGGLIANTLGNMPIIGKSIRSRSKKKVKESANEDADEKSGKKEKPGFFKRIFKTVFWSAVATGAWNLGKRIFPDERTKEIKSWFPWTDEAKEKKQKEESEKQKKDQEDPEVDQESPEVDQDNPEVDIELTAEETEITEEGERMYSEGYSDLYILTKMYQKGFVPMLSNTSNKLGMRFKKIFQGRHLGKKGEISLDLRSRIIQSIGKNRDIAMQMKIDAIANNTPDIAKDFDVKANKLISVLDDFEKGNIKSFDDLKKNHPDIIKDFGDKKFIQSQNKYLESIKIKSQAEFNRMAAIETTVKDTDIELKKIKAEAENKLKEIDNKAKNADESSKNKLRSESKKIVDDYNKKAAFLEKKTGLQMTHMNATEIQKISKIGIADNMLKFNGKIDGFLKSSKTGKFMLGASLFTLATNYASGDVTLEQVGLEVADTGIGMVPFVGGAYDVWTSITGEGIAGQLSTGDRWLRGVVGGVSVVLDVVGIFTFGAGMAGSAALKGSIGAGMAGSAALKGSIKGGTAIIKTTKSINKTQKVLKTVSKGAEIVKTGEKILGLGFLGYSLVAGAVPVAYQRIDKKTTSDIVVN